MRQWLRVKRDTLCGRNPEHVVSAGEPVQVIRFAEGHRDLIRCRLCAEGEAPEDLPAVFHRTAADPVKRMTQLRDAFSRPDVRLAAVGREPGEDDGD